MTKTRVRLIQFTAAALIAALTAAACIWLLRDEAVAASERRFAGMTGARQHSDFVTNIDFGESDFPQVHITTEIPAINRDTWITATMTITNTDEEFMFDDVSLRIRGRGNTTWWWEKRPFRVRFDEARPMLDSGHSARDWTFIANHYDNSMMRHYSAYHLATILDGMYVAPFARFVDVWFNGEFQGVYMLSIQHSYVTPGQVDLTAHDDPARSEFLLELDYRSRRDGPQFEAHIMVNARSYDLRFPVDMSRAHAEYAQDFLYRIEALLIQRSEEVFNYIHLPSFVDFYIIQELYQNVDVGLSSVFMQIRGQGDERRLEMGPVWDFDRSLGNDNRPAHELQPGNIIMTFPYDLAPRYPEGIWAANRHHWFFFLMEMPTFFNAVTERWNEIRDNEITEMIAHISHLAETYESSFERNFMRWPNLLGQRHQMQTPAIGAIDTFAGHVDYIVVHLERRMEWLDWYFNSRCCRSPRCLVCR